MRTSEVLRAVAFGPDGSLYIADASNECIRRIAPDGTITTVAGNGFGGFSGDGGPATEAMLQLSYDNGIESGIVDGLAIGSDGSIYIADAGNDRIRRVGPDGIITTIAGGGKALNGDGGLAVDATLFNPEGVAIGLDGSIYIADTYDHRVRRIGPDGIITTVAGDGRNCCTQLINIPAVQASLDEPQGIAIGPDGSLYIADSENGVLRVGLDGIIKTVEQTELQHPVAVAVGADGTLYIGTEYAGDPYYNRVWRIGLDGSSYVVAGTGVAGLGGDGGPAVKASLDAPVGVAVGSSGSVYIADSGNGRVRRIGVSLPGFSLTDFAIPSEDGSQLYQFDASGRHLKTLDALTSAVIYSFGYDSAGRLTSVTDGDGNVTKIERNANGLATAIVSPYGQRTSLTIAADGYLGSVIDPAGESTSMTYYQGGLLKSFTDARGNTATMTYDNQGRLTEDHDALYGYTTLARTELGGGSYKVITMDAENGTRQYEVDLSLGGETRTFTDGRGFKTVTGFSKSNGTETVKDPDGTVTTSILGPDPRFGMLAPVVTSEVVTMPSGLKSTTTDTRMATFQVPDDNTSPLDTLTDTVVDNGNTSTTAYNASARTLTSTSAEGRTTVSTVDDKGRVVLVQVPGVLDTSFSYDGNGRLNQVVQGDRTVTYAYDTNGNLASITDPLSQTTRFTYDLADRLQTETEPDNSVITFSYDQDGNMTGLTPPGESQSTFGYDNDNHLTSVTPPDVGTGNDTTTYTYNKANQVIGESFPDGTEIAYAYCECGRLTGITTPWGTYTYTYSSTTGVLSELDSPGGFSLSFGYDGALLTSTTQSGPVSGSVGWTYNSNLQVASESIDGGNTVTYGYDKDGLLTQAGDLTLTRDAGNGSITGSILGSVTDSVDYNQYGELASYQAAANGNDALQDTYTRDKLGASRRESRPLTA